MMNKYTTMLMVAAGFSLASHAALAQAPKVAAERPGSETEMPEQCLKLQHSGFTIKHETIARGGTAATTPRGGSYPAPRKYGEGGDDKWFIDSFQAHPKEGCRICGVTVAVKGNVSQNSLNNDSITLVGSNTAASQVVSGHLNTPTHTKLGGSTVALPNGPYSNTFTIGGQAWMNWYLASLAPSLDVLVQDDTTVTSIVVTYYYY